MGLLLPAAFLAACLSSAVLLPSNRSFPILLLHLTTEINPILFTIHLLVGFRLDLVGRPPFAAPYHDMAP